MLKISNLFSLLVFIVFFLIQTSISAQNQAPRFDPPLRSNYFFPEFNVTKPGDILLWLNATDNDDTDLQFGVETEYYKKLFTIKNVDGKHAMVLSNRIFDREIQEKYENIVFYVKDKPGNKVYQSVRFVILDIDDNQPLFRNTPYKINVLENHFVDSVIFDSIEAFDADGPLYNKFTFGLATNNNLFAIDKTIFLDTGLYSSRVILKHKLDYEKSKNHLINITAIGENSIFTATTELLINVIDYPDRKPEFSQSPYYVRVQEELQIGDSVLQVLAKDGDTGINNPCKYVIIEDSLEASYFTIESLTGIIRIKKQIDLESNDIIKLGGLLEFNVMAIEIGDENSYEHTKVTVAIQDINDNSPKFNKNSYDLIISPKSTIGTSLSLIDSEVDSIHVFDMDKGINGSFSLSLSRVLKKNGNSFVYENSSNDFEIVPKIALNDANLILKLKKPSSLQKKIGSTEHYHLFAKDNGIDGNLVYVDLHIKIENINEYAPQFDKKVYTLYIDENSPFNTTIGHLKAVDKDTFGNYGKISYDLKNGQERFQIDKNNGRVFTISENPNVQLDREAIDSYFMSVDAIDGGGLRTSAQLIIKLNDLNDNYPQFTNNLFSLNGLSNSNQKLNQNKSNILIGYIEENSAIWQESIKLQALDRDIGLNGVIEYEIIDGECFKEYFQIENKTNKIVLKKNLTLDFEEIYRIKQKTNFEVNSITGPISNDIHNLVLNPGEIDINLVVIARDLGVPSLSSRITAKIIVKDLNDNKPRFDKLFYTAQVLETSRFGDVVQVNAFDQDAPNTANSKIIYSIESGNKDKFSIDSSNGMVRINENSNLDKDLFGSAYKIKIVANDFDSINSKSLNTKNTDENSCFLLIEIIDVNNKKPQISKLPEVLYVSEDVGLNTLIAEINATDLDSDSNLIFYLIKNDRFFNDSSLDLKMEALDENNHQVDLSLVKDWFEIDSKNGSLYTKSVIDRELAENIQIVIGVEDLNASVSFKPQITTTVLKIKITDVNDNYPLFPNLKQINSDHLSIDNEDPLFEMYESVDENSKLNTKIAHLKAVDLDKNTNLTYKIIHSTDSDKMISINRLSGEIYVTNLIDHEKTKWINLTILVNDNATPRQKHSLVHFYCKINDLNDNSPKFLPQNTTEFEIYENNNPNFFITQLKAIDEDSGQFGTISYKILSGDRDKFEIDHLNGIFYAKAILDREEQHVYSLVIQARDNPLAPSSKQLSDSLSIKVRVLDRNDNKPACEQNKYTVETVQNVDIGTVLSQIKGVDNDIGLNSKLFYTMSQNEFFEMNTTTGQIKTKKKLIGVSGSYVYTVTILDNEGVGHYLSGYCSIEILVKDFNMHSPKFVYPNTNNTIRRLKASLPFGTYLLTVEAMDEDNGANGEIVYYLDENRVKSDDWKSFNLDSKTGVLSLNTKLNMMHQSVYSIDVIASDMGKPTQLDSRITLTFILVDDSNNTASFNRMEICLSKTFQCEKNYQTIIVKLKEEQDQLNSSVLLNLAKISDMTKNEQDICYYLIGKDRDYFNLNKSSGLLTPKKKLDREFRDEYEVAIKASEHCQCTIDPENNLDEKHCGFMMNVSSENFDSNDISLLKVKIVIQDVNDNLPKFEKKFYQIGITSDIDFGDVILESFAIDIDIESTLNISIQSSSLLSNIDKKHKNQLPFSLIFFDTELKKLERIRESKFQIKTQQYFKEQNNADLNKNIYFQFNLTVSDQDDLKDASTVQIILINKQQRVKLVFSQPLDKVVRFQDEFQDYISNLTGFRAYVDKISAHRNDEYEEEGSYDSITNQHALTDMLLHFVEPSSALFNLNSVKHKKNIDYMIVDAETILNILDRSKDSNLLRKYKLSLAEKYDDQGSSTFYKYGSAALEDDFGSFFLLSPTSRNTWNFFTKIFFSFLGVVLLFCLISMLLVCFCMRQKYKRKLKAERAMVKAFGLDQRSMTFNDALSGYLNHGFDSNSLLPIPGTNLYAYEGSNPIWLNKYDKIDSKANPSSSSCSSSSTTSEINDTSAMCCGGNRYKSKDPSQLVQGNLSKSQDISSFYFKQIDLTPPTSRCSPTSCSNSADKSPNKNQNLTLTSDILSVQELSQNFQSNEQTKNENSIMSSFKSDTLLTFASTSAPVVSESSVQINSIQFPNKQGKEIFSFKEQIKNLSDQMMKLNSINNNNKNKSISNLNSSEAQSNLFQGSSNNYTKIFDNYKQTQDNFPLANQPAQKDLCDLFAVESTVI